MKRVIIVGVGALGSHVAQFLRNHADLILVDFDRIEAKNLLSQLHAKSELGKNKATSLAKTIAFLFGIKQPVAIPHKLINDNASTLLRGCDLVVDCLDNGKSRKILQNAVRSMNIPCVHGGLSAAEFSYGRVIWDEHFTIDGEDKEGAATCADGELLPFISLVSATIALTAHTFLTSGAKNNYSISSISGAMRVA